MNNITLYPSNWLYNAGCIGLLKVLEELGDSISKLLQNNGTLNLSTSKNKDEIFSKWEDLSPKSKKGTSLVYGWKGAYYANQTESSIKNRIKTLLFPSSLAITKKTSVFSCSFCGKTFTIPKSKAVFLNQTFGNILLGSERTFSNMYWCNEARDYVCSKCEFILMCHHLAFTHLSGGSEIFINAPSFKTMYYLNKLAQEVLGATSMEEARTKREIFAISIIEYVTRLQTTLGIWTGMNIEIVHKYRERQNDNWRDKIEFFSLPYEIVKLLSDRHVASLLSQIGEFSILNKFLDGKFSELVDLGYRIMRIGLKPENERATSEKDFLNNVLRLNNNRNSPKQVAEKIFKLCALVEERQGGGRYGFRKIV